MVTWSLTKKLQSSSGKKIAFSTNGAGSTRGQHARVLARNLSVVQRGGPGAVVVSRPTHGASHQRGARVAVTETAPSSGWLRGHVRSSLKIHYIVGGLQLQCPWIGPTQMCATDLELHRPWRRQHAASLHPPRRAPSRPCCQGVPILHPSIGGALQEQRMTRQGRSRYQRPTGTRLLFLPWVKSLFSKIAASYQNLVQWCRRVWRDRNTRVIEIRTRVEAQVSNDELRLISSDLVGISGWPRLNTSLLPRLWDVYVARWHVLQLLHRW